MRTGVSANGVDIYWSRYLRIQPEFDYDTGFETINISQSQLFTYGISLINVDRVNA